MAELPLRYRDTDYLALHAFYGHIFGGNVVRASFRDGSGLDFSSR